MNLSVDTSDFEITFPGIPDEATCDTTVVARHPCDSEWLQAEYEDKPWYDPTPMDPTKSRPVACTACAEASTTTTTTAAFQSQSSAAAIGECGSFVPCISLFE